MPVQAIVMRRLREWLACLDPQRRQAAAAAPEARPLVSCIMPTCNRPAFVPQAVHYFLRQDYPAKELVVVDDGDHSIRGLLPRDRRIRYVRLHRRLPLGEKRNVAVARSRGEIIVHWDDDDWYGPARLSYQVSALLEAGAAIAALDMQVIYDVAPDRFWAVSPDLHRQIFSQDLHAGTIAYPKWLWRYFDGFKPLPSAEDFAFVEVARICGQRVVKLSSAGVYIYIRHGGNTWQFPCGEYIDPRGWTAIEPPALMPANDHAYYQRLSPAHATCASESSRGGAPVHPELLESRR
jgi:glycosyltransferase involved in cell wall biosynthesis